MFGNPVTVYGQFSVGTYGYIVPVDLSKIYAKEITGVQIQDSANSHLTSDVITDKYDISVLQNFINDEDCPDVAYAIASDILYLFLKESIYSYAQTILFNLYGIRYPKPVTSLSQNLDIRENEMELLLNYTIKQASLYNNKRLDPDIELNIKFLETKLKV